MRRTYAYNGIWMGGLIGVLVYAMTESELLGVLAGIGAVIGLCLAIRAFETAVSKGIDAATDRLANTIADRKNNKNAMQSGNLADRCNNPKVSEQKPENGAQKATQAAPQTVPAPKKTSGFCIYCGAPLPSGSSFCIQCGKPIPGAAKQKTMTAQQSAAASQPEKPQPSVTRPEQPVQKQPEVVQKQPEAVRKQPEAVQKQPEVVQKQPEAVRTLKTEKPVAKKSKKWLLIPIIAVLAVVAGILIFMAAKNRHPFGSKFGHSVNVSRRLDLDEDYDDRSVYLLNYDGGDQVILRVDKDDPQEIIEFKRFADTDEVVEGIFAWEDKICYIAIENLDASRMQASVRWIKKNDSTDSGTIFSQQYDHTTVDYSEPYLPLGLGGTKEARMRRSLAFQFGDYLVLSNLEESTQLNLETGEVQTGMDVLGLDADEQEIALLSVDRTAPVLVGYKDGYYYYWRLSMNSDAAESTLYRCKPGGKEQEVGPIGLDGSMDETQLGRVRFESEGLYYPDFVQMTGINLTNSKTGEVENAIAWQDMNSVYSYSMTEQALYYTAVDSLVRVSRANGEEKKIELPEQMLDGVYGVFAAGEDSCMLFDLMDSTQLYLYQNELHHLTHLPNLPVMQYEENDEGTVALSEESAAISSSSKAEEEATAEEPTEEEPTEETKASAAETPAVVGDGNALAGADWKSAYAQVFQNASAEYGELRFDEDDYETVARGLIFTTLVDFNNDGTSELVLMHTPQTGGAELYGEVWTWNGYEAVQIFSDCLIKESQTSMIDFSIYSDAQGAYIPVRDGLDQNPIQVHLYGFNGTEMTETYTYDNNDFFTAMENETALPDGRTLEYVTGSYYYVANRMDEYNLYVTGMKTGLSAYILTTKNDLGIGE